MTKRLFSTLLAERSHERPRSQALAWERTDVEARPPAVNISYTVSPIKTGIGSARLLPSFLRGCLIAIHACERWAAAGKAPQERRSPVFAENISKRSLEQWAPPPKSLDRTRPQAEPAIPRVPKRSLGTGWWRSERTFLFSTYIQSLFILAVFLLLVPAREVRGGLILSLSLGGPNQIAANQVAFDVEALFSSTNGTDGNVNAFTFSLDNLVTSSVLKLGTPNNYSRFTFDNFRNGWTGGVDPDYGTGGIAAVDPGDFLLPTGSAVVLARMVVDTAGLNGSFDVSLYDSLTSDASGFVDGNPENSFIFAPPPNVDVNLNASSSFSSITAVPEPSSFLSILCIGAIGLVRFIRKKK